MRVMVLGAGGQLGSDLSRLLARAPGVSLKAFKKQDLDITQFTNVRFAIETARPEVVINAAAFTKVDECERVPDTAMTVNYLAQKHLARVCRDFGALCVYLSTDYVFDGEKGAPYVEDDKPRPLNHYGLSKLWGEVGTRADANEGLIVRSSWLYGPTGENFPKKILARARAHHPLRVVNDQTGCPSYTPDLAAAIWWLIDHGALGIFHVTNSGACTWHDFARAILLQAGLSNPVTPITTDELNSPARRPRYSVLDNGKAERLGLPPMRPWFATLSDLLSTPP
ncbi:MAG: dTDP-4-dehydrorhamnose reductase [bacterium]